MTRKFRLEQVLTITAIILFNTSISLSAIPADSVPLDPTIRYGKLSNGLSYYIKDVDNGSSEISMNLIVKVGISQEERNQDEFAHLVEHLGFSAGKNISLKKSAKLFNEAGIQLGQFNGHTWNNYTDFTVNVSNKNPMAKNFVLNFFHEIIWNLELTEKNIKLERIAVLNETKGGDFSFSTLPYFMEKEIVGEGTEGAKDYVEHLKTFEYQELTQFYKKWYRPDLMALVIVGDIKDASELEENIISTFSKSKAYNKISSETEKKDEYLNKKKQFLKSEYNGGMKNIKNSPVSLRLYFRQKVKKDVGFYQNLKDKLTRKLFEDLLNKRYKEKRQDYNKFYSIRSKFLDPPIALRLDIITREGLKKEILLKADQTLKEVEKYGFSLGEFNEGKQDLLLEITKKDTLEANYWKNEIIALYVENEALPPNKKEVLAGIVKKFNLKKFNSLVKDYIKDTPEDISLTAYKGDPALKYSEETIRNWLSDSDSLSVTPYVIPQVPEFLMNPGKSISLKEGSVKEMNIKIPGAKKFLLENGITVILKSSKKNAEKSSNQFLNFRGFQKKGIECFPEEFYFSAVNLPEIILNSGIGKLNKFELKRYLDNKFEGNVQPYIELRESGIKGSISMKNLRTGFQLIYLNMTAPHFNKIAFEDWKRQTRLNSVYRNVTLEDFFSKISKFLPDNELLPQGSHFLRNLDKTEFRTVRAIYCQLFQNANDFTFLFSGNFNENEVLVLCRKYLGNLPVSPKVVSECNYQIKPDFRPGKSVSKTFFASVQMKVTLVRLVYAQPNSSTTLDWKEEIKLELLRRIMAELLINRLRFRSDKGGTYQVLVGRDYVSLRRYNKISIQFSCIPRDADRLIKESKEVVNSLISAPVNIKLFDKLKKGMVNQEEGYKDILNKIYNYVGNGKIWISASEKREYIKHLSTDDIQASAIKYLDGEPFEFKMLSIKQM